MSSISFRLVVEDELSEIVVAKICSTIHGNAKIFKCLRERGIGFIERNIRAFISASCAQRSFIVLIDLDLEDCAPNVIKRWKMPLPSAHLLFRVAVRETESWLLGDRKQFAGYFKIPLDKIPQNPETVPDPKELIVNLVRRYGDRRLKKSIVPESGSSARIGKTFASEMSAFAYSLWDVSEARKTSDSLQRFIKSIEKYIETSTG